MVEGTHSVFREKEREWRSQIAEGYVAEAGPSDALRRGWPGIRGLGGPCTGVQAVSSAG